MIGLIWAQDLSGGIGKSGTIPWRVPEDLVFFQQTTINNTVIMGKNTWNSLPVKLRPLAKRRNIVISSQQQIAGAVEELIVVGSPEIALQKAEQFKEDIWVIGGARVYEHFMPLADLLYVTEIKSTMQCDVFAPRISKQTWRLYDKTAWQTSTSGLDYRFLKYRSKSEI